MRYGKGKQVVTMSDFAEGSNKVCHRTWKASNKTSFIFRVAAIQDTKEVDRTKEDI